MFQDTLSIPTDHFFKFLAIFGLIATIYCASFPIIFIKPYNDKIDERNFLITDLKAKKGYLSGAIGDLKNKLPDSIRSNFIPYYFRTSAKLSDTCYYYILTNDSSLNKIIMDLNREYYDLAKTLFKIAVMDISYDVDTKNLKWHQLINYFLTVLTFCLTVWGMFLWWRYEKKLNNYQTKLDNYQDLLEEKLKIEIEALKPKK